MDAVTLQNSWDRVTKHGHAVPLYFYSHIFVSHPEVRSMFPLSMSGQRDKFVSALGRIVSHVDELESDASFLQQCLCRRAIVTHLLRDGGQHVVRALRH